jgi:hypothetical protein
MKKVLVSLALLFATSTFSAFGSTVDVSKLTPEQVAQVQKQVSDLSSAPVNVSASVRKEAEAWGELGANMGKAMVGAAKEVGVASTEFAQTGLGKVVVAIVAYKVVGRDILKIVFGSLVLLVGYSIAFWLLWTKRWSKIEYKYEPILWGAFNKKYVTSIYPSDTATSNSMGLGVLTLLVSTFIGLMVIF